MPIGKPNKIKPSKVRPYELTLGGPQAPWRIGCISLVNEARLPSGAVVQAKNMMQTQDGVWSTRWGSSNYGESLTGPITAGAEFVIYNSDNTTTQYHMVIDNGTIKYGKDGGAWTSITGHSYNTSVWTHMVQYQNFMLLANGIDNFSYVNLSTFTLETFTALSPPSTPSSSLSSTLSTGQYTIYYQVTAISEVGETTASTAVAVSVNIDRSNWYNPNASQVTTDSYYVTLTWPQVSGAVGYNIYASDNVSGVSYYLDSVQQPSSGSVTYTDYGNAAINDFIQVPLSDTTAAPKFSWIALSDNRLWACGDPNNPQRVYWSATNQEYPLAFSPYIGGGWVDVAPGSNQQPHWVGEFRSGQGTPMTTILTGEPSGYGSTWNVQITTAAIGNTQVAVPTLIQSLSTFGTLSPHAVILTNENVYFHSGIGAFFSTGSMPTLFNVLATNEVSLLIRPDVQLLTLGALPSITGIEYQRKLWWSVPYANNTNNRIFIYDLEKNNWNPYAFDFGVSGFFRYTDNSGELHLLAIPVGGTNLLEINENFNTDNGVPFDAHLQTGLIHPSPDHVQFVNVSKVYYEFGEPQGNLTLTTSGTAMDEPLAQLQTNDQAFGATDASNIGFSSFPFSAEPFSYTTGAPVATVELIQKKFQLIYQILNNFEIEVESTDNGSWTLNTVSIVGQFVPMLDDSSWWLSN